MLPPCFTPFRSTTLRWSAIRIVKYPCRDGPRRISHSVGLSCDRTSSTLATSPGKTLMVRISSATTRRYFGAYPCSGPCHCILTMNSRCPSFNSVHSLCVIVTMRPSPLPRMSGRVGVEAHTGILKPSGGRCLVREEVVVPHGDRLVKGVVAGRSFVRNSNP